MVSKTSGKETVVKSSRQYSPTHSTARTRSYPGLLLPCSRSSGPFSPSTNPERRSPDRSEVPSVDHRNRLLCSATLTQAKRKQNGSKTQALQNENENGNIPPLSTKGASSPSAGRFPAPISRDQCVNLAADPFMSVQVPAVFAAAWWDEHEHDGWTDDEGRAIKGMRRVRQLLAGAFNFQKNKSARAVEPVSGSARVFDPEVCE